MSREQEVRDGVDAMSDMLVENLLEELEAHVAPDADADARLAAKQALAIMLLDAAAEKLHAVLPAQYHSDCCAHHDGPKDKN